jgi:small subunit ribosomal protein S16
MTGSLEPIARNSYQHRSQFSREGNVTVAVRIRLKKLGRRHRPFFRICVMDSRTPRDGKTIEEIGTYDPMVRDKDKRVTMKADRVDYWISVGALPTDKVKVLIDKYKGTAPEVRIDGPREVVAPPPKPILATPKRKPGSAPVEEAAPAETATAEAAPASEAASEAESAPASE